MKKEKKQKGITLVALIITIIVLLILSAVTIRTVTGDGVIAHAKNAREQYEQKAAEENALLSNLTGYITGQIGGSKPSGPALSEIKIGDKVAYDEGYRADKKSDVDTNFQMDDMEWRVLDIEANGTVKLISNQPTESRLTLSGEDGWLNGPTKLDKLCSDLYANGTGVTARSLKVEDINKLAGVVTDADKKALNNSYGTKWRYKYNITTEKIQYSKTEDNGTTWTEYANTNYNKFKEPGKEIIDKDHLTRSADLEYSYYYYNVTSKISAKTEDNILVAELIYKGLDKDTGAVNSSGRTQWLSSRCVKCENNTAAFIEMEVRSDGTVSGMNLTRSDGMMYPLPMQVRPVVLLSSNTFTTKVDGVWQVNI